MQPRTFFSWLERITTGRRLLVVLVVEIALLVGENTLTFPLSVPYMRQLTGHPYLDMCAFCTADQIRENLDAFGPLGRGLQLWLMPTIDVAIPFTSAAVGLMALTFLGRGLSPRWTRWLRGLPLAALGLDLAENAGIVGLVLAYPRPAPALSTLSGMLTGAKFCAYAATVVAVLGIGLARALTRTSPTSRPLPPGGSRSTPEGT